MTRLLARVLALFGQRLDQDRARRGDAYVIRVEDAAGRRLMVRISASEIDQTSDRAGLLEAKAAFVIARLERPTRIGLRCG